MEKNDAKRLGALGAVVASALAITNLAMPSKAEACSSCENAYGGSTCWSNWVSSENCTVYPFSDPPYCLYYSSCMGS